MCGHVQPSYSSRAVPWYPSLQIIKEAFLWERCCTKKNTHARAHANLSSPSPHFTVWLPVEYTFSKNKTLAAINSGKYGNIRGMFAPSADTQTSGGSWSTAAQAATKPGSSKTVVNALFDMGATCWYFVQELVDRGVTTPIGIADTAIGGQRIEEFMNNATFADAIPCPDELGGKEVRLDNSPTSHDGRVSGASRQCPFGVGCKPLLLFG